MGAEHELLASVAGELTALITKLGRASRTRADVWAEARAAAAPTFDHATRVFGLSVLEREIVGVLLGAALGFGPRASSRMVLVPELVATLGTDRARAAAVIAALEPGAPLVRHELVTFGPAPDRTVGLVDAFWPRLLGIAPTTAAAHEEMVVPALDDLVLPEPLAEAARDAIAWMRDGGRTSPTLVIHGPRGSGRGALAAALAAQLGTGILRIDGAELTATTMASWLREIAWFQAVPVIVEADAAAPGALAALLGTMTGPCVLAAATPMIERVSAGDRRLRTLETAPLDAPARTLLWRAAITRCGGDPTQLDLERLGERFPFAPARLVSAARTLVAARPGATTEDAIALCRAIPEVRLGGLATRIETKYGWDDLVVGAGVRDELELVVAWGRRSHALFGAGGIGERARAPRGFACLFHGPPGTGKTLAAQVIARELGAELYRVDLAQIVDKYLGETEKRLDALFREAEAAGVILLFDEADAMFASRTDVRDARDRYANLETAFLLQRLEEHRGLTILTSNLQRNVDAAFTRRLAVIVELPMPGPDERARIWERLLPEPPRRAADVDIDLLAERIPVSGGDIRNAVFAAVLMAGRDGDVLAMRHVIVAAWRELAKVGRLIDPGDFGPWQDTLVEYTRTRR